MSDADLQDPIQYYFVDSKTAMLDKYGDILNDYPCPVQELSEKASASDMLWEGLR